MAQNVMVCCRFRPANKNERADGSDLVVSCDATGVRVLGDAAMLAAGAGASPVEEPTGPQHNQFNFDAVFDWDTPQADVFRRTAQPLAKDVFAGYNTTVFAYGQTGSGKTHTMMGGSKEESKGIIPRLVESIFQGIEDADDAIEFTVKLSYVEIYNERIRDLLTARGQSGDNLKIRETKGGGIYIEGVTETYVNSFGTVLNLMQSGQDNRAIAATNMNEQSSRSHSVFILTLGQLDKNTGSKKAAKLTLVDLAGSEKVNKTGAAGQTLVEAKGINKSLSALGNVINALTSAASHVPYRDSKLTRLLSDSLGGNSKTCLIITCSPMSSNLEETISTLRFGTRAKHIKNKPKINAERSVAEYKELLNKANSKISTQQQIIDALDKDVGALWAALTAIDPKYHVLPLPSLFSRQKGDGSTQHTPNHAADSSSPIPTRPSTGASSAESKDEEKIPEPEEKDDSDDEEDGYSTPRKTSSALLEPSPSPSRLDTTEILSPTTLGDETRQRSGSHGVAGLEQIISDNMELQQKLKDIQNEKEQLSEQLADKDREIEDINENFKNERKTFQDQLATEQKSREVAEEKSKGASEFMSQYQSMKSKLQLIEGEHQLEKSQLIAEKQTLTERIMLLQAQIERLSSPEAIAASSNTPPRRGSIMSSAPNSPDDDDDDNRRRTTRIRQSMPPLGAQRQNHQDESYDYSSQSHVETLTIALQRKCDQYMQLQLVRDNQNEHIVTLEAAIEESIIKYKDAQKSSETKIKELEQKLTTAENLCEKLIESGRFFRQDRRAQKTTTKIAMPLAGGHHRTSSSSTSNITTTPAATTNPRPSISGGGLFSFFRSSISSNSASQSQPASNAPSTVTSPLQPKNQMDPSN